ncbi:ABC transporter ATP-binding protein [Allostreptomyces psammosilenae]|uniref:ABC-type multidrug transport system fused ATPase/permease subunit n=1 Tax=Allostreptomyces psammosilenae TaxID=1892865 RepID=A0A852ZY91_9ACTN|nr:ABC transporter ATP-binding protein [Allostreptomyces psammosilenae]NYI07139.1 ABC-type multidrug transport system fused ATPase/permease subunit [Allostreptomyces psammosilenae]
MTAPGPDPAPGTRGALSTPATPGAAATPGTSDAPSAPRSPGEPAATTGPTAPPEPTGAPAATGPAAAAAAAAERRGVFLRGMRLIGSVIRDDPRTFALAATGGAVYGAMTVGVSEAVGWATDTTVIPAFESGRTTAGVLTAAFLVVAGAALVRAAGITLRRIYGGLLAYRAQARYRRRLIRRYLDVSLAWHARHPTGRLLSVANSDVESAALPLIPLAMGVGALTMLVVAVVAMLLTDPFLGAVGLLVLPALALLNAAYQRQQSPRAALAQRLRGEVSEIAHESFDGALVVKTLGREAEETERFADAAGRLRDANIAVGRSRAVFDPLLEALPGLGVLLVLLVGSLRLSSGVSTADLVQVAYLFTLLAFPVRAIGWVLGDLPRGVVGWDRIQAVLAAEERVSHGTATLPDDAGPARVEVSGVHHRHGDGPEVLSGLDLTLEPGRTIAVVGPTGSGKSTLTTLLLRLLDPERGTIRVDGTDLRDLARGELARHAALVPQSTFLFSDTVRGNITLGADIDDVRVADALRLARADGFVSRLPQGLDTPVGERGASLSGGQRQRIALARALVRRPRLLVLDDATSAVDPHVEAEILGALRSGAVAATVVVIAYRKATIALADEVLYLDGGRIVDSGTHEELLARCPGYTRLVTAYERAEARAAAQANGHPGTDDPHDPDEADGPAASDDLVEAR